MSQLRTVFPLPAVPPVVGTAPARVRCVRLGLRRSWIDLLGRPDVPSGFTPAYGIELHDPRLLEYVGAPESARLLSRNPEYWLHHLGHEKTLAAAL